MSSANEELRGRMKPVDDDSDDEDYLQAGGEYSESVPGKFRGRVEDYGKFASFSGTPLYQIGEVVYLSVTGQSQPSGPYVVVSIDTAAKYQIKRKDNNQPHPQPVPESDLVVPVP